MSRNETNGSSLALKIFKMEVIEASHAEAQSKRDTHERLTTQFASNTELGKKARAGFRNWTDQVVTLRKQLAQAIFNTYGKGIDDSGNIIWRD